MTSHWQKSARRTLETEANALKTLCEGLSEPFDQCCELIANSLGRVIVTGMGKSGHVSSKIAATLASTGCCAYFVHPAEASHGDLGMIMPEDVVIAISFSGESDELLQILPTLKAQGNDIIAITANAQSSLAQFSTIAVTLPKVPEACPHDLAPTTSTTMTMALGDALAIALLEHRGFTADQFAKSHPAGRLGKRLTLKAQDLMHRTPPTVLPSVSIQEALVSMSRGRLGCIFTVDDGRLLGIFTDGDLRRTLERNENLATTPIGNVHSAQPRSVAPESLAFNALQQMQDQSISALAVVENDALVGVITLLDCLNAGL